MENTAAESETSPVPTHQINTGSDGAVELVLVGDWRSPHDKFDAITEELPRSGLVKISANDDFQWSQLFAAKLYEFVHDDECTQVEFNFDHLPTSLKALMGVALAVPPLVENKSDNNKPSLRKNITGFIERVGAHTIYQVIFVGEITVSIMRFFTGRSDFRIREFMTACFQAGPNAFGIICFTSLLVGLILAYLGLVQFKAFGAQIYIANLVSVGMLREMGALITAIVMSGRTGAAFAAQLGTMKVREEIDALTTTGINTTDYLVLPRLSAMFFMMPILSLASIVCGVFGGLMVGLAEGITARLYLNRVIQVAGFDDFMVGVVKSFVFAALIGIASCQSGMRCGNDAAAVGDATTRAVVLSIVYIIMSDAIINIIANAIGA